MEIGTYFVVTEKALRKSEGKEFIQGVKGNHRPFFFIWETGVLLEVCFLLGDNTWF